MRIVLVREVRKKGVVIGVLSEKDIGRQWFRRSLLLMIEGMSHVSMPPKFLRLVLEVSVNSLAQSSDVTCRETLVRTARDLLDP